MTARTLPYFLIDATVDMATVMVGTLLLAGRRWRPKTGFAPCRTTSYATSA